MGITYLNHIGQCFELDIKYDLLNMPLQKYVKSFEKKLDLVNGMKRHQSSFKSGF